MKLTRIFKSFHKNKKRLEISTISGKEKISEAEQQTDVQDPRFKCRHVVGLFGFGILFFVAAHRLNMSVSIVAMVNNSATVNGISISSNSCIIEFEMDNVNTSKAIYVKESQGEFNWTPELQGYILGSNFLGYCLTQLPASKIAEVFGCKKVIFFGMLLSSICTFATPFAAWWHEYIVIIVQTLRGGGQGMFQTTLSILVANWFPASERGFVFTFMQSGMSMGAMAGGLGSGILCDSEFLGGWPSVFYVFGAVGIVFSILIALFLHENPAIHPRITTGEMKFILSGQENDLTENRPATPWRKVWTSVPVWALSAAFFGQFWSETQFMAVHSTYLGTILNYPIDQNGLFTSLPFLLQAVFAMSAGYISDQLNKRQYVGVDKARKFWHFIACLGYSVCIIGIHFARCDRTQAVIFSILAMGFVGFTFPGCVIVPADMSPTFAGAIMAITNALGTTAAFILPATVGLFTNEMQSLEQWDKVFYLSVAIVMMSGIIFCVFGSAEIQPWNFPEDSKEKVIKEEIYKRRRSYVTSC